KNRLATIKTHNPLDVKLFATLRTDDFLNIEKELHTLFSNKNSKREWFELHEEDLINLKINYGFNFLIPINSIKDTVIKNKHILDEIKEVRIDNSKIDHFVSYFEQLFDCKINDIKEIKRCCLKYDSELIKETIDSLFNQGTDTSTAYSLIYKVCGNIVESKDAPEKYFTKILKAIYYKHYQNALTAPDIEYLEEGYDRSLDINKVVKTLNSKKFYLNQNEYWSFINDNF